MTDIRDKIERWARWRVSEHRYSMGYGPTVIGRMLDGMPSTKCTVCDGAGKVAGHRVGAWSPHVECPNCAGNGKIKALSTKRKINPAFIPSTHREVDDPMSEHIDRIVSGFRGKQDKYFWVIIHEYCTSGTQEQKARRLNISYVNYKKRLQRAVEFIEEGLTVKKRIRPVESNICTLSPLML